MKTLTHMMAGGIIAAMLVVSGGYVHAETTPTTTTIQNRSKLQMQLRSLLVQLVERLQTQLTQQEATTDIKTETQIPQSATGDQDPYTYAPTAFDKVSSAIENGIMTVTITGSYPNECYSSFDPIIDYHDEVFAVTLRDKIFQGACDDTASDFETTIEINTNDLNNDSYRMVINDATTVVFDVGDEISVKIVD